MAIQLEIIYMLNKQGLIVHKPMVLLLGIPVLLTPIEPSLLWPLFLFLLMMTWISITFRSNGDSCEQLMATILAGVAIPALFSGLLIIRSIGDDGTGFALTTILLLMVWANDILAFIGGKSMGKHQLAPKISPNKTVEGFIWGFLGCFIALALGMAILPDYPLSLKLSIPFAALVGIFGPAGDLAESKLKRICDIKDSSGMMPGHGGLYDRFDAILFAAPAAAIYLKILTNFSIL